MEPLIALSFAANVVQFADFTTRVISESTRIYRARKYQSSDHTLSTDLQELEQQLLAYTSFIDFDDDVRVKMKEKPLHRKLEERGLSTEKKMQGQRVAYDPTLLNMDEETREILSVERAKHLSGCDAEIFRVCLKCEDLALNLRQGIAKLRRLSKPAWWSSFAEALTTVWGEERFRNMTQQLKDYREQMMMLLLISLRYVYFARK
jgi:hypothetical protein